MKIKKGIVLAGGTGSRLYPLTIATNKQLLPIFDKPAIYYPLSVLMLAGIQDILFISTPKDLPVLEKLFGDGRSLGMQFSYQVQMQPKGLPEAFILGEKFINNESVAMILGDNFFHAHGLSELLCDSIHHAKKAHIFTYHVENPSAYGIVVINEKNKIILIEEKPKYHLSNLAITGLYFFDASVCQKAKELIPSERNELEITDLLKAYLAEEELSFTSLRRGTVWFDVGTSHALLAASNYVQVLQDRQGIVISSPEEIAWRMGYIQKKPLENIIERLPKGYYKNYLSGLMEQ